MTILPLADICVVHLRMLTHNLYHFHRILFSQAGVSMLFLAAISGSFPAMKLSVNEKRRPLLKHKNTPHFYEHPPALYLSQNNYCTANHGESTFKPQLNMAADLNIHWGDTDKKYSTWTCILKCESYTFKFDMNVTDFVTIYLKLNSIKIQCGQHSQYVQVLNS